MSCYKEGIIGHNFYCIVFPGQRTAGVWGYRGKAGAEQLQAMLVFLLQTLLLRTLGSGLERKPMEHSFLLPVLSSGQGGSDPSHLQGLSESHSCA